MSSNSNYYQILQVSQKATQIEIKKAYRHLVKCFHPDSHRESANHDKIVQINAAYEVLKDPDRRRVYDRKILSESPYQASTRRQQRTAEAQNQYRRQRQQEKEADDLQSRWLKQVYRPIDRLARQILDPLEAQIESLSADPFDDELMEDFQSYLENCGEYLDRARQTFSSQPNPVKLAGVALNLYYCLNQIGDALEELKWFTLNYDDHYLHTGKEMFRIARHLHRQARGAAKVVAP